MRRLCSALILVAGFCALTGCKKDDASLVGSLGDFYDLQHQEVRARLYPSELAIEYVAENDEVPVRLTVLREPPLSTETYDLVERGEITGRADGVEIPRFITGNLTLRDFSPDPDARVRGEFEATFETGKDVASLAGDFDTTLEVIDAVSGYGVDVEFIDVAQFRR